MKTSSADLPLVSVIIICYNSAPTIEAALSSALGQSGSFQLDVIVVDDRSTDHTYQLLASLAKSGDFRVVRTKRNSGPAHARNQGIIAAAGQYLNFLDADDVLLPGKIDTQLGLLKAAKADICYTDCLLARGTRTELLSRLWPAKSGDIYNHLLSRNCIAIHAALLKTSLAKKYAFNEALKSSEDYDFWLRIARDGHTFFFLNEPLVQYTWRSDRLSKPSPQVYRQTYDVLLIHNHDLDEEGATNIQRHLLSLCQSTAFTYFDAGDPKSAWLWLRRASQYGRLSFLGKASLRASQIHPHLGLLVYRWGKSAKQIRDIPSFSHKGL